MSEIRVWAPRAQRVDLVRGEERDAMSRQPGGWWSIVADAAPGDEYAFSLDGGPARPDPRSMDQPHGVHGPSRLVDHGAYRWQAPAFRAPALAAGVIYELHVGTFTPQGTLDAAIERLDHLVSLGVTHVELMPLNAFDGAHGWGYDGVAWSAPHRSYTGPDGPDAVKRFVDACHGRGLAVILDVVYNHLGPSGNYLHEFGPYFTEAYDTPWGPAVNLDHAHCDEVRRFIVDNAMMWLRDYRFDALRLDAVHAFIDRSAMHVIEEIVVAAERLETETGRPLAIIAESDLNDPRVVRSREAGGYGAAAQWSDDFHHALHALLTGERAGYYADFGEIAHLAKALTNAYVYDGVHSAFRKRRHGRPPAGLPAERFLGYIQNHDQIGNRATGDRLSTLVSTEQLRTAAALVLLSPFVPLLFQGEEWGTERPFQFFTSFPDEDLGRAVREGRRREFHAFGWSAEDVPDPQSPETFERSRLDWSEPERDEHATMLAWHRELITIRRAYPELVGGPLEAGDVEFSEAERWLRVRRGRVLIVCNFGDEPIEAALTAPAPGAARLLAATSQACSLGEDGAVVVAPGGLVVYEQPE